MYDTAGTVHQWCWDWYDGNYYSYSPYSDPMGPSSGSMRMNRGGSWPDDPSFLRSADRNALFPEYRSQNHGFRLVIRW